MKVAEQVRHENCPHQQFVSPRHGEPSAMASKLELRWDDGVHGNLALSSKDALPYFCQPITNPFYDLSAINHRIPADAPPNALRNEPGISYAVKHSQELDSPPMSLHIIQKQLAQKSEPRRAFLKQHLLIFFTSLLINSPGA